MKPSDITVAVLMHDFRGGGAERVAIALCNGLVERGLTVFVMVLQKHGPMLRDLNPSVNVREVGAERVATSPFKIAKLVKQLNVDLVVSHMTHVNVAACIAALIGGFRNKLIVVEHNQMLNNYSVTKQKSVKLAYLLTRIAYKLPKKIIAVSEGVKQSVVSFARIDAERVEVIYNPVVNEQLLQFQADDKPPHAFFQAGVPVFVCVGRLTKQKNYPLFIAAFHKLIDKVDARAIILGEGPERDQLSSIIKQSGLSDRVSLHGFVDNPYWYMSAADALVLSSAWEGLPTVLIEALALSTKIVSTDCISGPTEILDNGKFGELVPVDDVDQLAVAMEKVLAKSYPHLKERAMDFTIDKAVEGYLQFC